VWCECVKCTSANNTNHEDIINEYSGLGLGQGPRQGLTTLHVKDQLIGQSSWPWRHRHYNRRWIVDGPARPERRPRLLLPAPATSKCSLVYGDLWQPTIDVLWLQPCDPGWLLTLFEYVVLTVTSHSPPADGALNATARLVVGANKFDQYDYVTAVLRDASALCLCLSKYSSR